MLVALLAAAAGAATPCSLPEAWSTCPVARSLHPVAWDYASAYRASLEEAMAGERASPLFLATVNEADVHWRLISATGQGLDLPQGSVERWTDLALAGSVLALDGVLGSIVDRSDDAAAVRTALDGMVSPSADVLFHPGGRVSVSHQNGGPLARRYQRAAEEEGFFSGDGEVEGGEHAAAAAAEARPGGRRGPANLPVRVHLAVGWTIRDLDAPPNAPPLSWGAELAVRNAGLTLWRADVDLLTFRWNALARQHLAARLSLGVGVHSEERGPAPDRWSAGLFWNPRPRAVVSLQRITPFSDEGGRVQLGVQVLLGGLLVGDRAKPPLRPNRLTSTTVSPSDAR